MLFKRVQRKITVLVCVTFSLASCVLNPNIDRRSVEQQLAGRPAPTFSTEEVAGYANADRSRPFRLSVRGNFLRSCAPITPPIRAMIREKIKTVEGVVTAVALESGLFDSVKVTRIEPASVTADVEALFAQALKMQPCKLPPLTSPLTVEIPFLMRLD